MQCSRTLTHIALHVRDLDPSVEFYRNFCGLKKVHERDDSKGGHVVWLAEPGRERDFILVVLPGDRAGTSANPITAIWVSPAEPERTLMGLLIEPGRQGAWCGSPGRSHIRLPITVA